jgi:head-tail adaptor
MNPGMLNKRISIQKLISSKIEYESFLWELESKLWAHKKVENRRCVFSKFGMSSDTTTVFTVRFNKNLNKNFSIVHENDFYIIVSIIDTEDKKQIQEVTAAKVILKTCEIIRLVSEKGLLNRPKDELKKIYEFPCCLAEKYIRNIQENVQSIIDETYILITPKGINIDNGDLAVIDGVTYNILTSHTLDEFRNEYEITVKKEV